MKKEQTAQKQISNVLSNSSITPLIAIIVMVIALCFTTDTFLTPSNLGNVLRSFSMYCIMAVGMTMVIIVAGIDLSVGSTLAVTSIVAALIIQSGADPIFAILGALLAGLIIGLVNGYLIAYVHLPAFVVTLGTQSALRGIALVVTDGWPINLTEQINKSWFRLIGRGELFGVLSMQAVIMIVVVLIGAFLLKKTKFGHHLYAVGGSERAAQLAGINERHIKLMAYTILGVLCAVVGIMYLSYVGAAQPTQGQNYETNVIAAAVIGGAAMSGGEGTMMGTLLGAMTIGILLNGLTLMGVSANYQKIAIGAVIVISVIISEKMKDTRRK